MIRSGLPTQRSDRGAEFSLVRGGLLFDLWCRLGLTDARLGLLSRRLLVTVIVVWLPLLVLSLIEGSAVTGVALPFANDLETHVRFLVAVPLLLLAEVVAHRRMLAVTSQFFERRLVPDAARDRFDAAVASVFRWRDTRTAEVVLLLAVYGFGVLYVWRTQVALDVQSWYGVWADGALRPSFAGWWLGLVSVPAFQFLLLRWYYRVVLWIRFLWQVSRIELQLVPTHPDRSGGLGFLGFVSLAFGPFVMAQSAVLAGVLANRIFFAGAGLLQFKAELMVWVLLTVVLVLGPLGMFVQRLEATARTGRREYGMLAQQYSRAFDQKWLRGGAPPGETLLGSADIQSLADMSGSLGIVSSMRWVPFSPHNAAEVVFMALVPFLPLALTILSPQELLERLLKMLL